MPIDHSQHASGVEATADDVIRVLGDMDAETLLAILALHPSLSDLEVAALRLVGDGEATGRKQATGAVAEILELLGADEDEETGLAQGPGNI